MHWPSRIAIVGVALLLLASVGAVFAPVVGHGFVNDDVYITLNLQVREGLS